MFLNTVIIIKTKVVLSIHIGDPGGFWRSWLGTKVFMFPKIFITIRLKILKTVEHTSWLSRNVLCALNWIFICNSVIVTLRHVFFKESLYINTHIISAVGIRVAQWVMSLDLTAHTSPSPIRRGFAPSFVNYKKGCTRFAATSDKAYQLLAQGRWFSGFLHH